MWLTDEGAQRKSSNENLAMKVVRAADTIWLCAEAPMNTVGALQPFGPSHKL